MNIVKAQNIAIWIVDILQEALVETEDEIGAILDMLSEEARESGQLNV